jgi:hypothetical protein
MPAMPPRFLFGPTTAEFADSRLGELRRAGECLAFGPNGVDLKVGYETRWDQIAAQFPEGWRPDLVALWLNYTAVPPDLWSAPVPLVGLATDWNLLWHAYRHLLLRCDAVLIDRPGAEALARAGIPHARPALLFGAAPDSLDGPFAAVRDIDVLFVGNLHPAVQRERLPWLAWLARLADRWNVVIRTGISGAECRAMLARARVAFNRSVRGEANMRALEAAAAGALLFQEVGNLELPGLFADRRECVYYRDEDLETLLEYYLSHEDERRAIAEAARAKVAALTFPALLKRAVEDLWEGSGPEIEPLALGRRSADGAASYTEGRRSADGAASYTEGRRSADGAASYTEADGSSVGGGSGPRPDPGQSSGALFERARARVSAAGADWPLAGRLWVNLSDTGTSGDDRLPSDLAAAADSPGVRAGAARHGLGILAPDPATAAESFRLAVEAEPASTPAGLALALALAAAGRRNDAIEQARRVLEGLESGRGSD